MALVQSPLLYIEGKMSLLLFFAAMQYGAIQKNLYVMSISRHNITVAVKIKSDKAIETMHQNP
jgi:hypothetical protein